MCNWWLFSGRLEWGILGGSESCGLWSIFVLVIEGFESVVCVSCGGDW